MTGIRINLETYLEKHQDEITEADYIMQLNHLNAQPYKHFVDQFKNALRVSKGHQDIKLFMLSSPKALRYFKERFTS